jgi:hypothetical protein
MQIAARELAYETVHARRILAKIRERIGSGISVGVDWARPWAASTRRRTPGILASGFMLSIVAADRSSVRSDVPSIEPADTPR